MIETSFFIHFARSFFIAECLCFRFSIRYLAFVAILFLCLMFAFLSTATLYSSLIQIYIHQNLRNFNFVNFFNIYEQILILQETQRNRLSHILNFYWDINNLLMINFTEAMVLNIFFTYKRKNSNTEMDDRLLNESS